MFNPHGNRTADGVVITEGLKVFTNELEVGTVTEDQTGQHEIGCCVRNGSEHTHNNGQMHLSTGWFTDHESGMNLRDNGCYCGHNHWFTISTAKGTKSFDGERIATVFEGRKAEGA